MGQQLNSWCRQLILLTITDDCPEVSFVMKIIKTADTAFGGVTYIKFHAQFQHEYT
jgi:hypothetical protein